MTNKYTAVDMRFDSTPLDTSLPDLTIGVKDGNLMYTRPEQILNRKRCRCFERRASRYYGAAVLLIKSTFHNAMPASTIRFSRRMGQVGYALRGKADAFFVTAPPA
ncbi:hypothetical protein H4R19_006613 [Coemansia spiralis]|nr:hypothetical protein H4R19_006613 [Coemansia spiralis]